ncbi:acyltransferase [Bradyrhizobium sp. LTSPM299]|uniref:acyltransferase family protein n=1 Tax=Bradyrhizobium sp. LTSPM299 TaxID=1619233 RepID=UPI0005C8D263|nr:acyltransferase [Bradyrhizobium sp. LTSPM299]
MDQAQASFFTSARARITLQDRLAIDDRPAGFDYLRVLLALLIMLDHSVIVCLGQPAQLALFQGFSRPFITCLVPMFFALSGFLIASSLIRCRTLVTFVGLRALRIVPALAVDTIFCAVILGPFYTSYSLRDYFLHPDFYKYFFNVIGYIHYHLPGVFADNPSGYVNAQLWTIPYELDCYLVLSLLAALGLHRKRLWFLVTTAMIVIGHLVYVTFKPAELNDVWQLLLPCFLVSVCAYLYRDKIEWSGRLAAVSVFVGLVLLSQQNSLMVLASIPLSYLTIWLGLFRLQRDPIIRSGDYSYPLYLYSFPIQQALYVSLQVCRVWWLNMFFAVPVTFLLAAFSWHLVEKPSQKFRYRLFAAERFFFPEPKTR